MKNHSSITSRANTTRSMLFKAGLVVFLIASGIFIWRGKLEELHPPLFDQSFQCEKPDERLLNQKFRYLAEGSQAIAFLGDDQTTVLKVFKAKHHTKRWFLNLFDSTEQKKGRADKWSRKLMSTCERSKIAYQKLKEETGLLYLHFHPTPGELNQKITLVDRLHLPTVIDADQTLFLLQSCAELMPERINRLVQSQDIEGLKQTIRSLMELFKIRAERGITDARQCFSINYGFIGDKAVQIDIGKIVESEEVKQHPEKELERITSHIHTWLQRHHPEVAKQL